MRSLKHFSTVARVIVTLIAATTTYSAAQSIRVPFHTDKQLSSEVRTTPRTKGDKITRKDTCWFFPLVGTTCAGAAGDTRNANINKFYDTAGQFSYLSQIKSTYNGASSSDTISADMFSLNFSNAMQMTLATNLQAGSLGTSTTTGGTPTLTTAGAGQAAQNMLYGGNIVASAIYPVIAIGASSITSTAGNFGAVAFLDAREGVDVQNFMPNTSTNVNSPTSHTATGIEGYLQYNSINLKGGTGSDANIFKGALFFGGSYGYSYTSHSYARDYGLGNNVSSGLGQISAGILISGVARVVVSRGFGPSQTYIDSTSSLPKTVNNFKAWSFGLVYQSPSPTKPAS